MEAGIKNVNLIRAIYLNYRQFGKLHSDGVSRGLSYRSDVS